MRYCPKTAAAFGAEPITKDQAEEWCRRMCRAGSAQCAGCELRRLWGVGEPAPQAKGAVPGRPVQVSLF